MNNLIIKSLWIGKELSNVERLCIRSFLDHGHEFHLYVYEDIKNVPAGVKIFDATTIISTDAIFTIDEGWAKGSYAGFADLFRLVLIQKLGGWWVDMDVICLKPFDLSVETVISSSYENEYKSLANNCVFKSPADSDFLTYCLDDLNTNSYKKTGFGSAGPLLFQQAVKALNINNVVAPYQYFNPVSWRFVGDLILNQTATKEKIKELLRPVLKPQTMAGRRVTSDSYAIHFWNEVWRGHNFDKNGKYSHSSLFEKLKRKHGITS